jgi:hypothetical protein
MKAAIKTHFSQTTAAAQATDDAKLLAAKGRAAVREVEIEIAKILDDGLDYRMDDLSGPSIGISRSGSESLKQNGYKQKIDPQGIPQSGSVTEQVEQTNLDLVARGKNGKASTVRYGTVKSMLLNEFLKQHRMIAQQQKQIEVLTAGLQKVGDQLELNKIAPLIVSDDSRRQM